VKYNMAKITVKVEDGMVQAVKGIPADVTVEVRNYDVGGVDEKVQGKKLRNSRVACAGILQ
jgi:hypothetical protein